VQDRKAVRNIAVLARHPDEQVRDAVAQTLGRLGGADAASVLVTLLEDRSRAVRMAATRSLREMGRDAVDIIRAELARRRPLRSLGLRLRLWWLSHRLVTDIEKR
jgi:HEAT repeat protein